MIAISESALWKKRLGDWVVNPYVGCAHGCVVRIQTRSALIERDFDGKPHVERVALDADAVRFMSTPELLRTFSAAIATASERLDITEEHALGEEGDPWCEHCRSYHPRPRDKTHHDALQCFAPWVEAEAGYSVHRGACPYEHGGACTCR